MNEFIREHLTRGTTSGRASKNTSFLMGLAGTSIPVLIMWKSDLLEK